MSIKTAQLNDLSIQFKTMIGEASVAKSEAAVIFVGDGIALLQTNDHRVQVGIVEIPFTDLPKPAKRYLERG